MSLKSTGRLSNEEASLVSSNPFPKKTTLFARAQFDYDPTMDHGLPAQGLFFRYGDVLKILNCADDDYWKASRINTDGSLETGIIPGQKREKLRLRNVKFNNVTHSNTSKAEKSGKKNKKFTLKKNKNTTQTEDDGNIDINNTPILSYEFVKEENVECRRPVILLGFMKESISDDLIHRDASLFMACIPHTSRPIREGEINGRDYHFVSSKEQMNEDLKAHKFIEAGEYKGNLYATSLQSVREVMHQDKHCILDVTGKAIHRLVSSNIHPIVILIKATSIDSMLQMNKRLTHEQALTLSNKIASIEQTFNHLFDAKLIGDNINDLFNAIKETISKNATVRWVKTEESY